MAGEVKPIRTKRDYEAALKEVERLWAQRRERVTATDWMCSQRSSMPMRRSTIRSIRHPEDDGLLLHPHIRILDYLPPFRGLAPDARPRSTKARRTAMTIRSVVLETGTATSFW